MSSSGDGASASGISSGREKTKLHNESNSSLASERPSQHSKESNEDVDDYNCPIVEENPSPHTDS